MVFWFIIFHLPGALRDILGEDRGNVSNVVAQELAVLFNWSLSISNLSHFVFIDILRFVKAHVQSVLLRFF
jgi:hypothetical protein